VGVTATVDILDADETSALQRFHDPL